MQARPTAGAIRGCVVSAIVVATVVAPSAAGAPTKEASSRDLAPATAESRVPAGYDVKRGNDYVYEGGDVVITLAASGQRIGCDSGYVCLYKDADYQTRRWQFRDERWQNLRTYMASDEVSSWKNRGDNARLGWDSIEQGIEPTFFMAAGGEAPHMGSWNDEASSVHG